MPCIPLRALPLALVLLLAPPALAAPLGPAEAADRAVAASPALQALDRALEAAGARARAAGAWPNPSVVSQVQLSPNRDHTMLTLGFKQPMDFRNLAGLRRSHAETEVEALRLARERTRRHVHYEARRAFVRLWLDEAARARHDRHVAYLEGELARGKKRVAAGGLAPHELIHVEYELASARLAQQAARHQAARDRAALNFLWNAPAGAPVAMPPLPDRPPAEIAPLETWLAEARTQRLELAEAAIAIRRESRAVQLAESLRFGEGELDLEAGSAANQDPLFYGTFAMPVPVWNDRSGEIAAARAEEARLEAERVGLERAIAQEVADAHLAGQQARERLQEAEAVLLPLAEHAIEKAEARVKAGAGDRTEILEGRKQRLDAEAAHLQALLEYHLAALRLEQAAGR